MKQQKTSHRMTSAVLALLLPTALNPGLAYAAGVSHTNPGLRDPISPRLPVPGGVTAIGALNMSLGNALSQTRLTPINTAKSLVDPGMAPLQTAAQGMRVAQAEVAAGVAAYLKAEATQEAGRGAPEPLNMSKDGEEGDVEKSLNLAAAAGYGATDPESSPSQSARQAGIGFDTIAGAAPRVVVTQELATADELFGPGRRIARPADARSQELTQKADEVAQWRAIRAAKAAGLQGADGLGKLTEHQEGVLRGIDDTATLLAIANTSAGQLAADMQVLRTMDGALKKNILRLGEDFLKTDVNGRSTPGAVFANLRHIYLQHLGRSRQDSGPLFELFGKAWGYADKQDFQGDLELLMVLHDLGKVEIPPDIKAAFAMFAQDGDPKYVEMFILPHVYASMHWIAQFGHQSGASGRQILALQRLIANHDFGPDLADPRNRELLTHWWPTAFAKQMAPMLVAMGIDAKYLPIDANGNRNYGHTERSGLGSVLSKYDRRIDLDSLFKYSNQDFNGWIKGLAKALEARSLLPQTTFQGLSMAQRMKTSLLWTRGELEAEWRATFEDPRYQERLKASGYDTWERFKAYPPFRDAMADNLRYLRIAAQVETDNQGAAPGVAQYRDGQGRLYRIVMEDPTDPKSAAKVYGPGFPAEGTDIQAVSGGPTTPVKFFFDMLQRYNPDIQVRIPEVVRVGYP